MVGSVALPHRTEIGVKEALIELLRKRLVVETELSYHTLEGRKQPDALLRDGGEYFLEAELGPEAKLLDGLLQAQDYVKTLGGLGGFAVLFPNELRKPMPLRVFEQVLPKARILAVATFAEKDARLPSKFEGTLEQVSDWISKQVLEPAAIPVAPDTDLTIRTLRDAVDYLQLGMARVGENQLELVFGGRSVFENILEFRARAYPIAEMRKGATYLLVNQILFYHVLSKTKSRSYAELDADRLARPEQLREYFEVVLKDDYTPVFGFNITRAMKDDMVDVLRKVIQAVKVLRPEKFQVDLLGKIFHDLIPYDTRKVVAAFYTNNEAAELIARLAIDDPDATVMDPACGSGTLLVASYHRKRELLESKGRAFGPAEHKKFLQDQITGIDIMPFAAHLAVVHLSLQSYLYLTDRVRVAVWDSTQLKPGIEIPAITRELREVEKQSPLEAYSEGKEYTPRREAYITKGVITAEAIGGEKLPLEKVDLAIMNPPFTRQERLPPDYKRLLDARLADYGSALHGQIGLYGYFIALAHRFTKDGGRVALVLPATMLRIQSAENIRRLLVEKFQIEYIITSWRKLAFSEGAWFRDIVLIAKKQPVLPKDRENQFCHIVTLKKPLVSTDYAISLAEEIANHKGHDSNDVHSSNDIYCREISHADLYEYLSNWFYYVSVFDPKVEVWWERFRHASESNLEQLSKTLLRKSGKIIRGIETKQEGYVTVQSAFIMRREASQRAGFSWMATHDGRTITAKNVGTSKEVVVEKHSVLPALRSSSNLAKPAILNENLDYVMVEWDKEFFGYLGPSARSKVKEWKEYVSERVGKLFVARRFVVPASGTIHLAYVSDDKISAPATMWIVKGFTDEENKILWLWLNSTPHLAQLLLNKIEDVWLNVHEYVLEDFLVPRLAMDAASKKELAKTFDEIRDQDFPSLSEQIESKHPLRRKIDLAVMKSLGYPEADAKAELEILYKLMKTEMAVLNELMQEREPMTE
ncbi:MAG: SAM-dependent DNA methyltransferase [Nitrososphaerota archaeon]|nr:SAM-dependent DNA methyltransferase [Nitrososphaerota archaeon]MDG7013192.1 SAM-dependent DNA methyltransferase [Nitrososphaerota archaeon]MDG7026273.1 SAM-dependent DNA methyltransferase [Nitrososphaerota archaeon]